MSWIDLDTVSITTAADGSATAYSSAFRGLLHTIRYLKHATTPFTDGVGFTITNETSGENIWVESNVNAAAVRYPRQFVHDPDDGTEDAAIVDKLALANERVKIVIAAGGNAKLGSFVIVGSGSFSG